MFTWSVPSRARRAGHAFRATASPTAAVHTRTIAVMSPSIGPMRPSSRLDLAVEAVHQPTLTAPGVTSEELRRLERQRLGARRGDDRLSDPADPLGKHQPAGRVELREHVVQEHERRRAPLLGDHLRLGEQEREHGQSLLPLRAEAPKLALSGAT